MDEDWDLNAVVRGCTAVSSLTASATTNSVSFFKSDLCPSTRFPQLDGGEFFHLFSLPDHFASKHDAGELQDLNLPFSTQSHLLYSPQARSHVSSVVSSISVSKEAAKQQSGKQSRCGSVTSSSASSNNTLRSKRRKNQQKKICQVPAESLISDAWAWRKYGQKPIKGSPYPRGYYRCSSSKGCLARKQVERNRSDPTMFIITYTAEHNHPAPTHRNSLAGSTRQKAPVPQLVANNANSNNLVLRPKPGCSSPAISVEDGFLNRSTTTEISRERFVVQENVEDDDEPCGLSEMCTGDDFFMGLEDLVGSSAVGS